MDNNNYQPQPQPQYQPQPQQQPAQPVYQQPVYQHPAYQQQPAYQQPYPQYQQVPGQYAAQPYVDPLLMPADEMSPEEKASRRKKGNLLCFISIGLQVLPYITSGILSGISEAFSSVSGNNSATTVLSSILSIATGGSYIGSWVLMIIARVKYKENKFAKVLMWVYIGLTIAYVVAIVLLIVMCWYLVKDCPG